MVLWAMLRQLVTPTSGVLLEYRKLHCPYLTLPVQCCPDHADNLLAIALNDKNVKLCRTLPPFATQGNSLHRY